MIIAPGGARAADTCPNAEFRTGLSAKLPECRAYEMVSPVKKNGSAVMSVAQVRATGDEVAYSASGAFSGSNSNLTAMYSARRTDEGWLTTPFNPPTLHRPAALLNQVYAAAFSEDLSRALIRTTYPVDELDQGGSLGNSDLYRTSAEEGYTWMSKGHSLPDVSTQGTTHGGSSENLDRVVFSTRRALVPEVLNESTQHVYIGDGEVTRLVSVAPGTGVPMTGTSSIHAASDVSNRIRIGGPMERSVSSDANTVAFVNSGQIYVRTQPMDPVHGETKQASRSVDGTTQCASAATYIGMSEDGERVWFTCPTALTSDPQGGLYEFRPEDGDLERLPFQLGRLRLAMDANLDYVYFFALEQLTPDAVPNGQNLYVVHNGITKLILTASGDTLLRQGVAPLSITDDGSKIAFEAEGNYDPERDTNGYTQVYTYDFETEALRCVSCPIDGSPATDVSAIANIGYEFLIANPRAFKGTISRDGSRVFFTSNMALVPEDVNGVADPYMYKDGRYWLLTSGTDPYLSIFGGASPDGDTAYILTYESLVPEDIDESVADLYAVRVGGGFPSQKTDLPDCGDNCQGGQSAAPSRPVVGSANAAGDGNLVLEPASRQPMLRVAAGRPVVGPAARLTLRTTAPGRVVVSGRLAKRSGIRVRGAGRHSVRVVLRPRARRALRKRGRLNVGLRVRYRPNQGRAVTTRVALTFKASRAKAGR